MYWNYTVSLYDILWNIQKLDWAAFHKEYTDTLRQRKNLWHFPDSIFKHSFLNENVPTVYTISLKFVHKGLIDNNTALVEIMAWRQTRDKPLSEAMMA